MSWITAIFGAIGGAIESLLGLSGSAGAAIGKLIEGVAGTVEAIADQVTTYLTTSLQGAFAALESSAKDLFANINQTVNEVAKVEAEVITPIKKYIDETTDLVNEINNGILKPITQVVQQTYGAITNLITELHTDIHGGIQGILEIPDALAGALTTVDAQLGRATQELGLFSRETTSTVLVPGLNEGIGGPLKNIAALSKTPYTSPLSLIDQIGQVQLGHCLENSDALAKFAGFRQALEQEEGWVAEAGKILMSILWFLPYLGESIKNDIACFGQKINQQNPVELLNMGEIVRANYRGILSDAEAVDEATRHGLSASRLQALKEIELWLPTAREAMELYYRGMISQDGLTKALEKRAMTPEDIAAVEGAFLEPVNPREVIQLYMREKMGEANFLGESLQSNPPEGIPDMYQPRYRQTKQAKWDWLAHWDIPKVEWWFTAWTRGMRTEEEFRLAAQLWNIPQEVIPDLIPVLQETVQLWMIPDMLASGVFTDAEALSFLHYIGMADRDAAIILKYGKIQQQAPLSAQAQEFASISASQAKTLYTSGIIDSPTYKVILTSHGYSDEAATLTIRLVDQQQAIDQRKNYVDGIVDQVNVGSISEADAVTNLYSSGYTTVEVDAAVLRMKSNAIAKSKVPDITTLDKMRIAGIIDQNVWSAGYALNGYSIEWITRYDALIGGENASTTQS